MNIAILSQTKEKNITGINKVTIGTVNELLKIDQQNNYVLLGGAKWLPINLKALHVPVVNTQEIPLNYVVYSNEINIVHSHYYPFRISENIKCGKVLTINDLIPYVHQEWCGKARYNFFDGPIRRCAEAADTIIAISEYTKSDIIKYYGIPEEKIKVIYCGLSSSLRLDREGKAVAGIEKNEYILSVSAINENKNQRGLLKAFFAFKERNRDCNIKLVLTGPIRNASAVKDIMDEHPKFLKDVIFTGYVSEEELNWLYQNALAFIYPSFYEGFGLPILEALAMGRAVICSNTTSMPEVGGNAVEYCNPYDIETIVGAIENVVLNSERRRQLEDCSILQAKKFSYSKAAEQTLEVYKRFE